MPSRVTVTCPSNQWPAPNFYNQIAFNEEQEVRVAVAYEKPINRPEIRQHVMRAMLSYAIPAGNA